ncbi:MAG: hypothetical protein Q9222_006951 [Ikaeria aurantiellina]
MTVPQSFNPQHNNSLQIPLSVEKDSSSANSPEYKEETLPQTAWQRAWKLIFYTPKRCRYDPANPPRFSIWLNLLFAFATAFTVANLYYNHPILHLLAQEFGVSNERASLIPTLAQAGYASGLLFLCPLGDVFPRRTYVLSLIFFTATAGAMPDGLVLRILSPHLGYLYDNRHTAIEYTPLRHASPDCQGTKASNPVMPLVSDLAPPHRRAQALSIVVSGLLLGMLFARLLSGILTNYTPWRTIYWLGFALQYLIFLLLFLFMPDYPSTNPSGMNYFRVLYSIFDIFIHHPLLIQACLVGSCTSATFLNFWTTLTFLLSAPPYEYSTLVIGLFALIGIASMFLGPVYSRYVTDRFIPLFSVVLGLTICLTGTCIGTYTGTHTVAGPIMQAALLDFGIQISQIANRSAIYGILPKAKNRINTAYMICAFCGQLVGTAVGNHVFAIGGWVGSGSVSVGFLCAALGLCCLRGPREKGWVGWGGGWSIRRDKPVRDNGIVHEDALPERRTDVNTHVDIGETEKGSPPAIGEGSGRKS